MKYQDLGYNRFLIKTIMPSARQTPLGARQSIPTGSLSASSMFSPINATTDIKFSSTDYNTAAWTAGTIYFPDGSNSGQVVAGNTGNISATTYVYFDKDKPGELKTTTSPDEAVGPTKFMIAIVETTEVGKKCRITPTIAAGLVVSNITADQIAAGTITANEIATETITADEIAAGTITADKLSVTQLDAVAANTGTLTVDESISVGNTNVKIDGTNRRIIVNDGTNDRVLIGYQLGGF